MSTKAIQKSPSQHLVTAPQAPRFQPRPFAPEFAPEPTATDRVSSAPPGSVVGTRGSLLSNPTLTQPVQCQRDRSNSDVAAQALSAPSPGKSLPLPIQRKFETAFGTSFADVSIHEGDQARAIGAHAFTRGSEIHFAPGQYNPSSSQGQALLGHELTHVVQQRAGRVAAPQGMEVPINSDRALEAEADTLGARAARGESAAVQETASGIQRQAEGSVVQCLFGKYGKSSVLPTDEQRQRAREQQRQYELQYSQQRYLPPRGGYSIPSQNSQTAFPLSAEQVGDAANITSAGISMFDSLRPSPLLANFGTALSLANTAGQAFNDPNAANMAQVSLAPLSLIPGVGMGMGILDGGVSLYNRVRNLQGEDRVQSLSELVGKSLQGQYERGTLRHNMMHGAHNDNYMPDDMEKL
jgi:Domain of unknown function (DUF4157)